MTWQQSASIPESDTCLELKFEKNNKIFNGSNATYLFLFYLNTNFTEKTVGIREIWTRIAREEGKHVDH